MEVEVEGESGASDIVERIGVGTGTGWRRLVVEDAKI